MMVMLSKGGWGCQMLLGVSPILACCLISLVKDAVSEVFYRYLVYHLHCLFNV